MIWYRPYIVLRISSKKVKYDTEKKKQKKKNTNEIDQEKVREIKEQRRN